MSRWGCQRRQALTLMRPVGEALAAAEDRQVKGLSRRRQSKPAVSRRSSSSTKEIERLYIELDGVLARMRVAVCRWSKRNGTAQATSIVRSKPERCFAQSAGPSGQSWLLGCMWIRQRQSSMRYVARRTAKGGFDWLLYQLAVEGGLEQAKQVVVLGDGAPWIWNLAAEHFPGAVQIMDLYHAKEHVWDVAHAVFGPGTAAGTAWATHCLLAAGSRARLPTLVSAITALPPIPPEPGQARSIPERAVDYFTTNAERMRYPVFRAQGMHIGSGIAEAACKTIVSTRAKRSGMRWTPEGLDALLPLRTSVLNEAYDSLWEARICCLIAYNEFIHPCTVTVHGVCLQAISILVY